LREKSKRYLLKNVKKTKLNIFLQNSKQLENVKNNRNAVLTANYLLTRDLSARGKRADFITPPEKLKNNAGPKIKNHLYRN